MDAESLRTALIDLIQQAHVELQVFLARLSETERAEIGTPQRWAARELVAHIADWWDIQGERIARIARAEPVDSFGWSDAINAEIRAAALERAWDDIEAEADAAVTALLATVRELDGPLLMEPGRAAPLVRPLWRLVLGNGYIHPRSHLSLYLSQHGQVEAATAIQEAMAADVLALGGPDDLRAEAHYNLGCFYAITQRPDQAMTELRTACRIDPALAPYAATDDDLAPLRALPAFATIVAGG